MYVELDYLQQYLSQDGHSVRVYSMCLNLTALDSRRFHSRKKLSQAETEKERKKERSGGTVPVPRHLLTVRDRLGIASRVNATEGWCRLDLASRLSDGRIPPPYHVAANLCFLAAQRRQRRPKARQGDRIYAPARRDEVHGVCGSLHNFPRSVFRTAFKTHCRIARKKMELNAHKKNSARLKKKYQIEC